MSMMSTGTDIAAASAGAPMASTGWSEKLAKSGCEGMRMIEGFCRKRNEFIREYLGSHHGASTANVTGSKHRRPFNVLQQGVGVIAPNLVARNPTLRIKPRRPMLKGSATVLKMLGEHANEREDFTTVLRELVVDAIFTCGIAYTAIMEDGMGVMDGDMFKPTGRMGTDIVSLDDFVPDPTAKRFRQMGFGGHRMRFEKQFALQRGLFSEDFINACPMFDEPVSRGNRVDDYMLGSVNRDDANEFGEHFYVMQYTLRREHMTIYMPGIRDSKDIPEGGTIFEEREYYGPEESLPYDFLGFAYAPEVLMPVAPVGIWMDMHLALNVIARKLVDQVKAMKNIVAGDLAAEDDLMALDQAENTGMVRVRNIDRLKALNWGAPADSTLQTFQFMMQLSNVIQGNNNMTGGLQANAKTATEAEILSAGANVRLSDMQELVYRFATDVQKRRLWYLFNDPFLKEILTREVSPGVSIQLPVEHDMLEGDFMDYNYAIEVASMQKVDPQVRVKRKMDHAQVVALAIQLEQMSGGRFNADSFIKMTGEDLYEPGELLEIWRTPEAAMEFLTVMGMYNPQGGGMGQPQGAAPVGGAPQQGGGGFRVRAPGRPGSPGMAGRSQTGASSPNFDRSANTAASKAAS